MVWKNFKLNKKQKKLNKFSERQVIIRPSDGVIRPSALREKLTFIEQVHPKNERKNRRLKTTKLGSEVIITTPQIQINNIYRDFLSKTTSLIFNLNFSKVYSNPYIQQSSKGIEESLNRNLRLKKFNPVTFKIKSNFKRYFNLRTLLFRSFWIDKFINSLIQKGKKLLVWHCFFNIMSKLKIIFMRSPVLLIFEILELYKAPLKALPSKNKTRKVIVRVHLVAWWKQYTQVLRWLRQILKTSHKINKKWEMVVYSELNSLIKNESNSMIRKKIELNNQLIAFGRVSLHFRWNKRFFKKASKIKV